MDLPTVWFLLIAALFVGYFILEGFDFGVGALLTTLGRDDTERRVIINTIAPVWDANEVWLITAVAAMFAAFPDWYATLLSGFYLPALAIVLALIVRGVAFEYRGKHDDTAWRTRWDHAIVASSAAPAVLWGLIFANITHGVPLDAAHEYTGDLLTLLNPYALLGGATTGALFLTHGAVFLSLKTTGELRRRAGRLATRTGPATIALTTGFLGWTLLTGPGGGVPGTTAALAAAAALTAVGALLAGLAALRAGREGWAFTGTATGIALSVAVLFAVGHPDLLTSSTHPAHSLTIANAAASPYTLNLITWVGALFAPLVLAYQAWTYWVFRRRIDVAHIPGH